MRYTGIQPQYFPRLHYFARILNSDIYMIRDECQFVLKHKYPDGQTKPSYQAHCPIKISTGIHTLTIPTQHGNKKAINETLISYHQNWIDNHLKTLEFAYKKSPNYSFVFPEIEHILKQKYENLADLTTTTIIWGIIKLLGKNSKTDLSINSLNQTLKSQDIFRLKQIYQSTKLNLFTPNDNLTANQKIITFCKAVGATEDFCGGTSVAAYLDNDIFKKNNITVTVQDWNCQEYKQAFEKHGFIKNLSIIDLLMNNDASSAIKIING